MALPPLDSLDGVHGSADNGECELGVVQMRVHLPPFARCLVQFITAHAGIVKARNANQNGMFVNVGFTGSTGHIVAIQGLVGGR